jgi:hypothetical protein
MKKETLVKYLKLDTHGRSVVDEVVRSLNHDHEIILKHAMDMNETIRYLEKEILSESFNSPEDVLSKIRSYIEDKRNKP